MKLLFKPIKESLKRVQAATKANIKSQKERANIMKNELVIIGNFIENLSQDEESKDLQPDFWAYVATTWPLDPRPPGTQLEGTYRKILKGLNEKATENPVTLSKGAGLPSTNGSTNVPISSTNS